MIFVELLFAFIVSILCAAILLPATAHVPWRRRHPDIEPFEVFVFLVILFLATWAGGIWLVPIGPRLWGVAWGNFLVVGLLVALLVGAVTRRRRGAPHDASEAPGVGPVRAPVLNVLTLVFLLLLVLAIVAAYARLRR